MITDLLPEISRAAERVAKDWSAVTESDDLYQDMVSHILDRDHAERILDMEPGDRWSTLRKIGTQIASQSRTDFDHFTGNFFYSTQDVRSILGAGALTGTREQTSTERVDIDRGMKLLRSRNAGYSDLIERRYMFGIRIENRMTLTRAVDALTECMNRAHINRDAAHIEGPGTRLVLTNAQARAQTEREY
ncbi:hypothetical protein ACFWY9_28720 [Amycolatopsis sp. NPDC059027]|uniref:hypothetical protein n=1 Tax=Amycolatopsis sp. NPDC059027 TaxID=3346709 RepID=UPI00366A6BC2